MNRRCFIQKASLLPAAAILTTADADGATPQAAPAELSRKRFIADEEKVTAQALRNSVVFGDQFTLWQSSYGAPDLVKCPYRTETSGFFIPYNMYPCEPAAHALYRLHEETRVQDYKIAADRYSTFQINLVQDPMRPYVTTVQLDGKKKWPFDYPYMYGYALTCYGLFCRHNPREGAFEQKAYAVHRWLQKFRRPDSYFGVGYACGRAPDCQFSSDLSQTGNGIVSFYEASHYEPALRDALGLSKFFLTEWKEGSGEGVWSSKLGCWLISPWPGTGAENFTDQQFNENAWAPSTYTASMYLLRLRPYVKDSEVREEIAKKCVSAFRWCYDACQFEDGAHGLFGRDDKWVGATAAALLIYLKLREAGLIPSSVEAAYRGRVEKSWKWLLENTKRDTFPPDGYIRVHGTTTKNPVENLWVGMCWAVQALLDGGREFSVA